MVPQWVKTYEHLLHSPDLVPSDIFSVSLFKKHLAGEKFLTKKRAKEADSGDLHGGLRGRPRRGI